MKFCHLPGWHARPDFSVRLSSAKTQAMDDYQAKLSQEATLWGQEAQRMAQQVPPDWRWHQHLRHNIIMHNGPIEMLLAQAPAV